MSSYKKTKNGHIITVKKWDNVVTVQNIETGVTIDTAFSDHVKAMMVAKSL